MGLYATADQVRDNLVKFQDPQAILKLTNPIIETHLGYVEAKINAYCRKLYVLPFVSPIDLTITGLAVDLTTIRLLRRFFAQAPKRSDLEKDMGDILRQTLMDIVPDKNGKVNLILNHPLLSTIRQRPDGSYVFTGGWLETDFAFFGIDSSTDQTHSKNYFNINNEFGDNSDAVTRTLL